MNRQDNNCQGGIGVHAKESEENCMGIDICDNHFRASWGDF